MKEISRIINLKEKVNGTSRMVMFWRELMSKSQNKQKKTKSLQQKRRVKADHLSPSLIYYGIARPT